MAEELARLKSSLGHLYGSGNHEYISGIDESVRFLKDTPIQLLRDSVVTLPNGGRSSDVTTVPTVPVIPCLPY